MSERVESRNVTMYPQDWSVVDQSGASMGLSTSTALRVIVRQWAQHFQAAIQRGPVVAAEGDIDMDTRDQAQVTALAAANRLAAEGR